jgi:hypothetical protein
VGLRDGIGEEGAWKLNSRSEGAVSNVGVLGRVGGGDGEVGTLNVGMDEGDGGDGTIEGGGNSSKNRICGGFCWAWLGDELAIAPTPNRNKGTEDAAATSV